MDFVNKYFAIRYYAEIVGAIIFALLLLMYVVVAIVSLIKKKLGK